MVTVGIMANGPTELLPDLASLKHKIDIWIGADRGALSLIEHQINVDVALGDFDSINSDEKKNIQNQVKRFIQYPKEKDETDLELALNKAFAFSPHKIYLFGVTGRRFDHTLVNVQILNTIEKRNIKGFIMDRYNKVKLTTPGEYTVMKENKYPNVSFLPLTPVVKGLTLDGFYYSLTNENLPMGSTLCISNKLLSNKGTFFYKEGILLLVKSRDSF